MRNRGVIDRLCRDLDAGPVGGPLAHEILPDALLRGLGASAVAMYSVEPALGGQKMVRAGFAGMPSGFARTYGDHIRSHRTTGAYDWRSAPLGQRNRLVDVPPTPILLSLTGTQVHDHFRMNSDQYARLCEGLEATPEPVNEFETPSALIQ
jgi:hypothetical protein